MFVFLGVCVWCVYLDLDDRNSHSLHGGWWMGENKTRVNCCFEDPSQIFYKHIISWFSFGRYMVVMMDKLKFYLQLFFFCRVVVISISLFFSRTSFQHLTSTWSFLFSLNVLFFLFIFLLFMHTLMESGVYCSFKINEKNSWE